LSVVPAKAAAQNGTVSTTSSILYTTVGTPVTTTVKYTVATGALANGETIIITPSISSGPAAASMAIGAVAAGSFTVGMTTAGAEAPFSTTDASGNAAIAVSGGVLTATANGTPNPTTSGKLAGTISVNPDVPGVYVIALTPTGTSVATGTAATLYVVARSATASVSGTGTLTSSWSCAVVTTGYGCSDGTDNNTLSVFAPAGTTIASGQVKMQVLTSADSISSSGKRC